MSGDLNRKMGLSVPINARPTMVSMATLDRQRAAVSFVPRKGKVAAVETVELARGILKDKMNAGTFNEGLGSFFDRHLKYVHLMDLMPRSGGGPGPVRPLGGDSQDHIPAVLCIDGRKPLSHIALRHLVESFNLAQFGLGRNDVVGVVLSNGPELGMCLLCCLAYHCCAPINSKYTPEEIVAELKSFKAKALIIPQEGFKFFDPLPEETVNSICNDMPELLVLKLQPDEVTCGNFQLNLFRAPASGLKDPIPKEANRRDDKALVLHTSGTSGQKKVVPYTVNTIMVGAACVMSSWDLTPQDINLNMMPLFHIGGIARNLVAPLMGGGASVLAPAFDPQLFWDIAIKSGATWYYAAPTMHQLILAEGKNRDPSYVKQHRIRMIANAAGGLVPSLASEMQRFYGCCILPSYGMTECMPISSPPTSYRLERPGTSGIACGPEMQIMNYERTHELKRGETGYICVRGPPLFGGYEGNPKANEGIFKDGWFDTGDMGYMDDDGYIYITGRSKEVINSGGEIISPFEIEEVVGQHPRVAQAMAFSAPHDEMQETVGVVMVLKAGQPRVDLPELHKFVGEKLHPSKWPRVIVYMNDTPRNSANKVQRIKFADRVKMQELSDSMPPATRLFEAIAPPFGSDLSVKIEMKQVDLEAGVPAAEKVLASEHGVASCALILRGPLGDDGAVGPLLPGPVAFVTPDTLDPAAIMASMASKVDGYLVPRKVLPMSELPKLPSGNVDRNNLANIALTGGANAEKPKNGVEAGVQQLFMQVLDLPAPPALDADFFQEGGTSLRAGKLMGMLRQKFGVNLPVAVLFKAKTPRELAAELALADPNLIAQHQLEESLAPVNPAAAAGAPGAAAPSGPGTAAASVKKANEPRGKYVSWSQTNLLALVMQLIPLLVIHPLVYTYKRGTFFFGMFYIARPNVNIPSESKSLTFQLYVALLFAVGWVGVTLPWFAILMKWILVGRFKAGKYPLWGPYYLRCWLAQSIVWTCGRGLYRFHPWTLNWYYRLLGAKIGKNCNISYQMKMSEYDLIEIGDNCCMDAGKIQPAVYEFGEMVLAPIKIGNNVHTCHKCIIASGHTIPDNTCMGPVQSSYESQEWGPQWKKYCREAIPTCHWALKLFVGFPIIILVKIILPIAPPTGMILIMLWKAPWGPTLEDYVIFLNDGFRILFFVLTLITRRIVSPYFWLGGAFLTKWLIVGKFTPGRRDRSEWNKFRHWLFAEIMDSGFWGDVLHLLGSHYENVSRIYRLMGAKIGKRVYWPGSNLDSICEFDLLTIGDDVVFGSRTSVIMCDAEEAKPIVIGSGSMIADRCFLLPGVVVGKNAVLGSICTTAPGYHYPPGSIWMGTRNGNGAVVDMGSPEAENEPTIKPFGRAFYNRDADYFVLPLIFHSFWNHLAEAFIATYWVVPALMTLRLIKYIEDHSFDATYHFMDVIWMVLVLRMAWILPMAFFALALDVGAKWVIMGRRKPGNYFWDESSYCQRWQMYLAVCGIRSRSLDDRGVFDLISGSAYTVWFYRALGATVGENVLLYPKGADPPMTEPDLVDLGDYCCIDDASLIAHINSKGHFQLNVLKVGAGAVMRAGSRLLSGGEMDLNSRLLEHTLFPSGDIADPNSTWQGAPADLYKDDPYVNKAPEQPALQVVVEEPDLEGKDVDGTVDFQVSAVVDASHFAVSGAPSKRFSGSGRVSMRKGSVKPNERPVVWASGRSGLFLLREAQLGKELQATASMRRTMSKAGRPSHEIPPPPHSGYRTGALRPAESARLPPRASAGPSQISLPGMSSVPTPLSTHHSAPSPQHSAGSPVLSPTVSNPTVHMETVKEDK